MVELVALPCAVYVSKVHLRPVPITETSWEAVTFRPRAGASSRGFGDLSSFPQCLHNQPLLSEACPLLPPGFLLVPWVLNY